MTKKDFVKVAKMLGAEKSQTIINDNEAARIAVLACTLGMCAIFAEANPRFDRTVFLTAVADECDRLVALAR